MQYMYVTDPYPRKPEDEVTVPCNTPISRMLLLYPINTNAWHLDTWTQIIGTVSGISWYITNEGMDVDVDEAIYALSWNWRAWYLKAMPHG